MSKTIKETNAALQRAQQEYNDALKCTIVRTVDLLEFIEAADRRQRCVISTDAQNRTHARLLEQLKAAIELYAISPNQEEKQNETQNE